MKLASEQLVFITLWGIHSDENINSGTTVSLDVMWYTSHNNVTKVNKKV